MFDPSAWRAGVLHEDPFSLNLVLALGVRTSDGGRAVTAIGANGVEMAAVEEGSAWGDTLRIPTDAARALYDALAQHFGGTSNSKQLRAVYDAERARVDKFINHLIKES
jgi:hypothetical protein